MTKKQTEQRLNALERSNGVCAVCGKPLIYGQGQYAHRIGNTETNRSKYGSFFIDSEFNGEYVCCLSCNATVDVGKSQGEQMKVLCDILTKEINKFYRGE